MKTCKDLITAMALLGPDGVASFTFEIGASDTTLNSPVSSVVVHARCIAAPGDAMVATEMAVSVSVFDDAREYARAFEALHPNAIMTNRKLLEYFICIRCGQPLHPESYYNLPTKTF